jgi:hypothetical protein
MLKNDLFFILNLAHCPFQNNFLAKKCTGPFAELDDDILDN